jgi:hypothetical protein
MELPPVPKAASRAELLIDVNSDGSDSAVSLHELHLRHVFDKLDTDVNGGIDITELKSRLITMAGRDIEEWEFRKMFKQLDRNNDGSIDFQEFLHGYHILTETQHRTCRDVVMHEVLRVRHPCEVQRMYWDKVLGAILVYSLMSIPLRVCLSLPAAVYSPFWIIDLLVDFYFLLDIALSFRVGFITAEGVFIKDLCAIAKKCVLHRVALTRRALRTALRSFCAVHSPIALGALPSAPPHVLHFTSYLKMWFWIDLLTSLPLTPAVEVMSESITIPTGGAFMRLPRVVRIVRIIRLLKLLKLAKLANMMSSWGADESGFTMLMKLGKLLFVVFFIAHMCGCVWCLTNFGMADEDGYLPSNGWITNNNLMTKWDAHSEWTLPLHQDAVDKTWAYVVSVYWAFTTLTTVGFGDVTPAGYAEVAWTVVVMYIGTCAFGYIVGSVTSIIMHEDKVAVMVKEKIENISAYMSLRMLPQELQERVKQYYDTAWRQKTVFDENTILRELPSYLRNEVVGIAYRDLVVDVPMLRNLPPTYLTEIVMRLHPERVLPSQVVIRRAEIGSTMYIVSEGLLRVYTTDTFTDGAISFLTGANAVTPGLGVIDEAVKAHVLVRLEESGPIPEFLRHRGVVDGTLWAILTPEQRREVAALDPAHRTASQRRTRGRDDGSLPTHGLNAVRVWLVSHVDDIASDEEMRRTLASIAKGHESASDVGSMSTGTVAQRLVERRKRRQSSVGAVLVHAKFGARSSHSASSRIAGNLLRGACMHRGQLARDALDFDASSNETSTGVSPRPAADTGPAPAPAPAICPEGETEAEGVDPMQLKVQSFSGSGDDKKRQWDSVLEAVWKSKTDVAELPSCVPASLPTIPPPLLVVLVLPPPSSRERTRCARARALIAARARPSLQVTHVDI